MGHGILLFIMPAPLTLPLTGYLILETGLVRYTMQMSDLGQCSDILAKIASSQPTQLYNIGTINNTATDRAEAVHVSVNSNSAVFWSQLSAIVLNTYYVAQDSALVPSFNEKQGTQLNFVWAPPTGMRLWFATRFEIQEGLPPVLNHYALAASKPGEGVLFRPVLPNIHPNATVCTGADDKLALADRMRSPWTMPSMHEFGVTMLNLSKWNRDLLSPLVSHGIPKLIRFKPDGTQLPSTEVNWTQFTEPTSFDTINRINPLMP